MEFTKEQLSELICKHTEKENGLQDLMEIMLESLMVSERREYLQEEGLAGNKCNGYRPGRTYSHGRTLTFRVTGTATSIPGYWPYCATRKISASALRAHSTPRA